MSRIPFGACTAKEMLFERVRWGHLACKLAMVGSIISVLGACTPLAKKATLPPSQLEQFTHWQMEGKLGIRTPEKGRSAAVNWLQQGDNYHIQLFGPFGAGKVHIQKQGTKVTLREGKDVRSAKSARTLFRSVSGLDLPIDRLSLWITGRLSNSKLDKKGSDRESDIQYNDDGTVLSFQLNDWKVNVNRYTQLQNLKLPAKMTLRNPHYKAVFVIKQWRAIEK